MKLFVKLMFALLFLAVMLPFTVLKGPDGGTLMSFSDIGLPDFSMPDIPSMPSGDDMKSAIDGGKDVVYQWRDAEGTVQFTTEPPPAGVDFTVRDFDPNTNVIQAVELPVEEVEEEPEEVAESPDKVLDDPDNPYSPENVKKLIQEAKDIQKVLNERYKDQDALLNQ